MSGNNNKTSFNSDISQWDLSKVKSKKQKAVNFTANTNNWDLSNLKSINITDYDISKDNAPTFKKEDMSKIQKLEDAFNGCSLLKEDLNWNVEETIMEKDGLVPNQQKNDFQETAIKKELKNFDMSKVKEIRGNISDIDNNTKKITIKNSK